MQGVEDGVPPDPPDAGAAEVAAWRVAARRAEAVHRLPVDRYVGLTVEEAKALAAQEGRRVRVLARLGRSLKSFAPDRVNVVLDAAGRVREAGTDRWPSTVLPERPEPGGR